jgi:hypothetical protein
MIAADCVVVYLANLMFNECGDDLFNGMLGVGLVVRNRVLAGWDGQNWIAVIQKHNQYSANPASEPKMWNLGDPLRDDKFRRCLAMANSIYEGREKDITKGALRYAELNNCSEEFAEKIVRPTRVNPENGCVELLHNRVAQIGKRTFFK